MAVVHIGVGSNLGDRVRNCTRALEELGKKGITILRRSSLYETAPWGVTNQPRFVNMVVEARTSLEPIELLGLLKDVERTVGRTETFRWGPRVVDLDILFYNDMTVVSDVLCLPHPHLTEREFVLLPLCEIAPDKVHPTLGKTVRTLLEELRHDKNYSGKKQGKDRVH